MKWDGKLAKCCRISGRIKAHNINVSIYEVIYIALFLAFNVNILVGIKYFSRLEARSILKSVIGQYSLHHVLVPNVHG